MANGKYVGMTLMKFEELGVTVNGEAVDIRPKGFCGFLPVFDSREDAAKAGWEDDKVLGIKADSIAD